MDDFLKAMEGLIKASQATYDNWPNKPRLGSKWQDCYKLWKAGWTVKEYVAGENDAVIVKWGKDELVVDVRLSFSDQLVWLEFMEKQGEK